MKHPFKFNAHNLEELFNKTNKLATFQRKLERQAEVDETKYPRDKYVGDGFEFFTELLVHIMPYTRELGGIHNYEPIIADDNGADGIALNWDGKQCVIQCKYRGDNRTELTGNKDHLGNLVKEATLKYDIPKQKGKQVSKYFVITTADGLHYYTEDEYFHGLVECIGRQQLRKLVDNNIGFWDRCREVVKEIKIDLESQK